MNGRRAFLLVLALMMSATAFADDARMTIRGSVVMDNDPIPGATIRFRNAEVRDRHKVSDAYGKFEIVVPAGSYEVTAGLEGFEPATQNVVGWSAAELELTMQLRMSPTECAITIVSCTLPNYMNVRVVDSLRVPLPGAKVQFSSDETTLDLVADREGKFSITFGPEIRADYTLRVSNEKFESRVVTGTFPDAGFDLEIALTHLDE